MSKNKPECSILCKVEGEAFRRYRGLLGRVFLLGRLGFRRGRGGLSTRLAFGRRGRRRYWHHRDGADASPVGRLNSENSLC